MELTYALLGKRFVHVDQVDNGLGCGCICPECEDDLIARNKGEIRSHHFAHQKDSNCRATNESVKHLMAKKVLLEHKELFLPELNASINKYETNITIEQERIQVFKEIRLEERMDAIIADVLAYDKHKEPYIIEFKVTHGVDEEKMSKLKILNYNVIEVDLSNIDVLDENHMREMLVTSACDAEWLHHRKMTEVEKQFIEASDLSKVIQRGVVKHIDNCPLKKREYYRKYYASLRDDCFSCQHYFGYSDDRVICNGKLKIDSMEALKSIIEVKKVGGWINYVKFQDNSEEEYKQLEPEIKTLYQISQERNNKPFLVKNVKTQAAFYINIDPQEQMRRYGNVRGKMYIKGILQGVRKILGVNKSEWFYIEK